MAWHFKKPVNLTAIVVLAKLAGSRLMARGYMGKRWGILWCRFEPGTKPYERKRKRS